MRPITTIQELWSYCLFCPICRDITREISIQGGPPEVTQIKSYRKVDHFLEIDCFVTVSKKQYGITYYLDCLRNTFTQTIKEIGIQDPPINRASSANFYIYFLADCRVCNSTHTNSQDIELDILKKKVSNIGVSLEGVYLLKQKDKYHLTIQHKDQKILVSRMIEDPDSGELIDDNKVVSFPLTHLDFSKPKKLINRIKTLLVFS